jgi:hypothetical protein
MRDRRFEPRHETNEPVELFWSDSSGADQAGAANLRDLSRSGASVQSKHPIPVRIPLRISIRDQVLKAQVRSCVRTPSGYLVGVLFDPEFQGRIKAKR